MAARAYADYVLCNTPLCPGADRPLLPVAVAGPDAVVCMCAYRGRDVDAVVDSSHVVVYPLKARCKDGDVTTVLVCECGDMAATRETLRACDDLSATSASGASVSERCVRDP